MSSIDIGHALRALVAISAREQFKFYQQKGRLLSALVRPTLWLLVFAAGFQNVFGISILPPYQTYIPYQLYIVPGLLSMVLLFNGMQSSLGMVYDREMGMMRLLLTAPLPRSWLLFSKLSSGVLLSLVQAYGFIALCLLFQIEVPLLGLLFVFPALVLSGFMLGAIGLWLSVYIRQLENFASTMNFVIFPMFFLSPALYPLWTLKESGAWAVFEIASFNPFSYAVELIRFALHGQFNLQASIIVALTAIAFFALATRGYDPQRGAVRRIQRN